MEKESLVKVTNHRKLHPNHFFLKRSGFFLLSNVGNGERSVYWTINDVRRKAFAATAKNAFEVRESFARNPPSFFSPLHHQSQFFCKHAHTHLPANALILLMWINSHCIPTHLTLKYTWKKKTRNPNPDLISSWFKKNASGPNHQTNYGKLAFHGVSLFLTAGTVYVQRWWFFLLAVTLQEKKEYMPPPISRKKNKSRKVKIFLLLWNTCCCYCVA